MSTKKKKAKKTTTTKYTVEYIYNNEIEVYDKDGDAIDNFNLFEDDNVLPNTCSMRELTGFNSNEYIDFKRLYGPVKVRNAAKEYMISLDYNPYLYNENCKKDDNVYKSLKELGFKPIYEYEGNGGNVITFIYNH